MNIFFMPSSSSSSDSGAFFSYGFSVLAAELRGGDTVSDSCGMVSHSSSSIIS